MTDTTEPHAEHLGGDQRPPAADIRAGYLGFVAHEMRNPLSTALWSAELLGRLSVEDRGGARGEKLTGMCLRTLARLRTLLEDYFLVERLAVGGLPLKAEAIPLAEVIAQVQDKSDAELTVAQLPEVTLTADRSLVERLIDSLVGAAGHDTAVNLEVSVRDGALELRVAGAPPAPDALEVPSKATPSDPTGRALALMVARSVVQAHGGSLRLDSGAYVAALPLVPRAGTAP